MEPIRNVLRHKKASVKYYEAEATKIDYEKRIVYAKDDSEIKGDTMDAEIPFDMLVVGVGAENATFGIPGVREHSCFLKEVGDAQKIRKQIMDCIETASFKDQSDEEIKRLLHMVVVGGGPTGVEFAGELQDFFMEDLMKWIPSIKEHFHITLVEALPNVLPMFSKQLIDYTESSFKEEHIEIRTKTMVKNVTDKYLEAESTGPDGKKKLEQIPYGLLVWATGNALRPVVKDLMTQIPAQKNARRGLEVNEYLVVNGTENIWAVGDCAIANYAPTAQVAAQEGAFLARLFNTMAKTDEVEADLKELSAKQGSAKPDDRKEVLAEIETRQKQLRRIKQVGPFSYSHQGSLAYIGAEKAVADVSWFSGNIASGGTMTYLFWKSAYLSMCFSSKFDPKCVYGRSVLTFDSEKQSSGDGGLDEGEVLWTGCQQRISALRGTGTEGGKAIHEGVRDVVARRGMEAWQCCDIRRQIRNDHRLGSVTCTWKERVAQQRLGGSDREQCSL